MHIRGAWPPLAPGPRGDGEGSPSPCAQPQNDTLVTSPMGCGEGEGWRGESGAGGASGGVPGQAATLQSGRRDLRDSPHACAVAGPVSFSTLRSWEAAPVRRPILSVLPFLSCTCQPSPHILCPSPRLPISSPTHTSSQPPGPPFRVCAQRATRPPGCGGYQSKDPGGAVPDRAAGTGRDGTLCFLWEGRCRCSAVQRPWGRMVPEVSADPGGQGSRTEQDAGVGSVGLFWG